MVHKDNIIFCSSFSYPMGMASTMRVQHLLDSLNRNNFQTKVLLIKNSIHNIEKYGINGYYNDTEYYVAKSRLWFLLKYLKCFKFISDKKEAKSLNVLYVYDNINIENIALVLYARILNYKIILDIVEDYHLHIEDVSFKKNINLKSSFIIERINKSILDGIVVISTYLKEKCEKKWSYKIPVILIPISAYIRGNLSKNIGKRSFVFVYSGSFGKKDGIPCLLTAFKLLSQNYPDIELHLSGIGNNAEIIVKNASHERIKYFGYLNEEDYYTFIYDADVLCMTRTNSAYSNAGFPFKLGEYLATGNPVIATDVSDVSTYLENMKDIILIKPDDVEELYSAMKFLIENKDQGEIIGLNGQKKCNQHFNPLLNGEKLVKFIQSL